MKRSGKNLKKNLAEAAKNDSLVPVFQDEVHFQAQTTITRKWVPKGSEPKVMSKPGKNSIAYSGFVIPETGQLYVNKPGWFNYETVIASIRDFIRQCPIEDGKQYLMILDNAPWHKKAMRLIKDEMNEEYQDIRDKVVFLSLPPYSPDLNPIEQVWRITRREKTHNKYFAGLDKLIETIDAFFATFAEGSEKLKSLCSFEWFKPVGPEAA